MTPESHTALSRSEWIELAVAHLIKCGYNPTPGLTVLAQQLYATYPGLTAIEAVEEDLSHLE